MRRKRSVADLAATGAAEEIRHDKDECEEEGNRIEAAFGPA